MKAITRRSPGSAHDHIICLVFIIIIYMIMCTTAGTDPCSYPYKSYQLQAEAWLSGKTMLDKNYEYLELAIYNGNYYVSFPPVPSIPVFIWILLFGRNVPGGMLQKVYICITCLMILSELHRTKRIPRTHAICISLGFCFASAMLPITLIGGVWYEAQILCFMLSIGAIIAMNRLKPTLSCICYALAVGCRPFSICLGPVLAVMFIQSDYFRRLGETLHKLLPGLLSGLAIAGVYAAYNYIRFGDPFEFGHRYLPEFQRAINGQFSLAYVPDNIRIMLFGSPFYIANGHLQIVQSGFSMFISCPILICSTIRTLRDIVKRKMTTIKTVILCMSMLNLFLLLMHRTAGGHQFGLRYAIELIPFVFARYITDPHEKNISIPESALMLAGLIFNMIGGILVHI